MVCDQKIMCSLSQSQTFQYVVGIIFLLSGSALLLLVNNKYLMIPQRPSPSKEYPVS